MKGGGSLIIAMPSLLGLRKKNPDSEFVLICTSEAGIFSDITGLFDRHIIVDDRNLFTLALTSLKALKTSFRSSCCIDLEPNSILAAVFAMLTCSTQRIGLVATTNHARRGWAYTSAIAFNPHAPIHVYYDKIVEECGAAPTSAADCRKAILSRLPKPDRPKGKAKTIAIVAFTSGYTKERMMPPETWAALLQQNHKNDPLHLLILGSSHNDLAAQKLADAMKNLVPFAHIENCAGRWSLMQTAAHMAICDEVWSVDSGPLHIAR
ncbi:MAG: glycosyltransferase family 9 protein, partial [Alphaproteobacteria bacterium]|nr:glycosyltransferase family 9 protein [Alphaproteobacteria bacterium]